MSSSPTRVPNSAQRVSNAINRANQMNQPTYCKECGSVYFIEAQASMFTPASNGFRSISTSPQKVYVCLCGKTQLHPGYNAAAPAGSERAFFGEALAAAANSQEGRSLDTIAQGTVSVTEHRRVVDTLNDLIERFNTFTAGGAVDAVDTVEIPVESDQDFIDEQPTHQGSMVTFENEDANPAAVLPIANGLRGRSAAAGAPAATDGVKWVEGQSRPAVAGGARARMRRQGA